MPVINGNGRDLITINGRQQAYQGMAHVRKEMVTETAVEKTKGNGLDEYYVNVEDEKGQTQRIVVYGDHLDFAFRGQKTTPEIMINGKAAKLVAYDDEQTTFFQGMVQGAKRGLLDAFEHFGDMGKRIIGGVAAAGGLALAGGTLFTLAAKGGLLGAGWAAGGGLTGVIGALAGPITWGSISVAGTALGIIALAGAFKGGAAAIANRPRMETMAAVTQEAIQFNPQRPGAATQPVPQQPIVQPVPQQPVPQQPRPEPPSADSLAAPVPPADPFKIKKLTK